MRQYQSPLECEVDDRSTDEPSCIHLSPISTYDRSYITNILGGFDEQMIHLQKQNQFNIFSSPQNPFK